MFTYGEQHLSAGRTCATLQTRWSPAASLVQLPAQSCTPTQVYCRLVPQDSSLPSYGGGQGKTVNSSLPYLNTTLGSVNADWHALWCFIPTACTPLHASTAGNVRECLAGVP